jgi:crotonobetainyl-CoA:carnitine CoA-transferase CaiB-like acyl-CoA transferase
MNGVEAIVGAYIEPVAPSPRSDAYAQMFADPQVRHRGMIQYASDPDLGEVTHIRTPIKIGEGIPVRNAAPKLGQHNAEIFRRLGVSDAEMRNLRAKGVM